MYIIVEAVFVHAGKLKNKENEENVSDSALAAYVNWWMYIPYWISLNTYIIYMHSYKSYITYII